MALINCPECGLQVSTNAEICPHCGNPLKNMIRTNKFSMRIRL